MREKIRTGVIAIVIVCFSVLLMASCAKKQVKVSEGVEPAAKVEPGKAATPAKPGADDYQKREAARLAKLKELQLAQMIAEFEGENIYFDFDKSELKPASKAVLKKKAEWLRANEPYALRIDGHCDERGTNEYNLALGERRAHAAMKFLVALGVAEHRISTVTYGEEKPADPGHNEDAWAKNRRDEFKLVKRW